MISRAYPEFMDRRYFGRVLEELERISKALGVDEDVLEKTREILAMSIDRGLQRGRSYRCAVVAAIYAASRMAGKPIPIKQISIVTEIPLKSLRSCYNTLVKLLGRDLGFVRPPSPEEQLIPIAKKLGLESSVVEEARKILEAIRGSPELRGKDPTGYAAAAIYIASQRLGRRITKSRISFEIGITEVTIRTRVKEILSKLGQGG